MKKILASLLLAQSCFTMHARYGCLDNSYHLAKRGDPKMYHLVQCSCECEKKYVMMPNGTCTKCMHRHDSLYLQDIFERTKAKKAAINVSQLKKFKSKN